MNTVKTFLSLILLVLVSTSSFSQDSNSSKEEVKLYLETYFEHLDLTSDQKVEFTFISKKYGSQLKELKSSDASGLSKYKTYKKIQKSKSKDMEALLSPEQFKIYEKTQKEIEKKIKEQRKNK